MIKATIIVFAVVLFTGILITGLEMYEQNKKKIALALSFLAGTCIFGILLSLSHDVVESFAKGAGMAAITTLYFTILAYMKPTNSLKMMWKLLFLIFVTVMSLVFYMKYIVGGLF